METFRSFTLLPVWWEGWLLLPFVHLCCECGVDVDVCQWEGLGVEPLPRAASRWLQSLVMGLEALVTVDLRLGRKEIRNRTDE